MNNNAVNTLTSAWEDAFNRRDVGALVALYTPQARLLTPTCVIATGTEEIRAYWTTVIEHGITGHRFEAVENGEDGGTLWEAGRWRAISPGGGEHGAQREGNYTVICRREGADWRLHLHIWN